MNLVKKLALWKQENLISETQQHAIIEYENKQQKPLALYTIFAFSMFCIGLGIISLISANWQEIPSSIKLFFDFVILSLTAYGIYYSKENAKQNLLDALILLYAILIMASIGLVAQIYQLQSENYLAYFIWAMLTLPFIFFTSKKVLVFVWLPVFIMSSLDLLLNIVWFDKIINIINNNYPLALVVSFITLLSLFYVALSHYAKNKIPTLIYSLKFWLICYITLAIISMDFFAKGQVLFLYYNQVISSEYGWEVVWLIISAILVAISILIHMSYRFKQGYLLGSIVCIIFAYSLLYTYLPKTTLNVEFIGFSLTLLILLDVAFFAYKSNNIKLLNLATIILALRVFIVYLQVFGSLLTTGLGLVSSGVVLLLVVYACKKIKIMNIKLIGGQNNE